MTIKNIKKQYIPTTLTTRYELTPYDELDAVVMEHQDKAQHFVAVCSFKGKEGFVNVPMADGEYSDLVTGNKVLVHNGKLALASHAQAFSI